MSRTMRAYKDRQRKICSILYYQISKNFNESAISIVRYKLYILYIIVYFASICKLCELIINNPNTMHYNA